MRAALSCCTAALLAASAGAQQPASPVATTTEFRTKSGIKPWVDPDTPEDHQSYVSSRGRTWDLVMSDEFNTPGRDFRPGKDHLWTSIEKPDGVNAALEYYSHNMTSTACDNEDGSGTCYYYIQVMDEHIQFSAYNMYTNPPGYQKVEMYYRSGMVQSWNKFCFQGGMLEVSAQLPGAVSPQSGNPDLAKGPSGIVSGLDQEEITYYPTWPGIWMMGNLGRAIFSASTNRMWPFSYNRCEPDVFDPKNQRISACDANPGFGLNPNQGRGAPEIDLLEGGGSAISSSLQIGPGMPEEFRLFAVDPKIDRYECIYTGDCKTPGANNPGVPSAVYNRRKHKSWYQGLRYQSNPMCAPDDTMKQTYEPVAAAAGKITLNACTLQVCSASFDGYANLSLVDGIGPHHWGINYNGTCFPKINGYTGAYLCDPDNQHTQCASPRPDNRTKTNVMKPFNYQMDAISSNWPVHLGAYTDYLVYQLEWVTGANGYVRWMLAGHPIFEVTSEAIENVPQDEANSNPRKIMLEEPMYLIFNVAVSGSWGAKPKNRGSVCRGDNKNEKVNRICDDYPMFMKIDYIRLYQDLGDDLETDNYMQVGCDPKSHPTKEFINANIKDYRDDDNPVEEVAGGAFCVKDDDCTILPEGELQSIKLVTGKCVKQRCQCMSGEAWGGPRCTLILDSTKALSGTGPTMLEGYGPPFEVAVGVAVFVVFVTTLSVWWAVRKVHAEARTALRQATTDKSAAVRGSSNDMVQSWGPGPARADYHNNFV